MKRTRVAVVGSYEGVFFTIVRAEILKIETKRG